MKEVLIFAAIIAFMIMIYSILHHGNTQEEQKKIDKQGEKGCLLFLICIAGLVLLYIFKNS
jgi:hypothetical protein